MQRSDQSPYDTPVRTCYLGLYSTLGHKNARIKGSDAGWSSLAARRAHNPKVIGSNPIPATKHLKGLIALCVKPFFNACPSPTLSSSAMSILSLALILTKHLVQAAILFCKKTFFIPHRPPYPFDHRLGQYLAWIRHSVQISRLHLASHTGP
jgi:hypothetical protein